MGKPYQANLDNPERKRGTQTLGSETSQYQEEKKKIFISRVAASEKEEAQTRRTYFVIDFFDDKVSVRGL